jgi:hypothetical protein
VEPSTNVRFIVAAMQHQQLISKSAMGRKCNRVSFLDPGIVEAITPLPLDARQRTKISKPQFFRDVPIITVRCSHHVVASVRFKLNRALLSAKIRFNDSKLAWV